MNARRLTRACVSFGILSGFLGVTEIGCIRVEPEEHGDDRGSDSKSPGGVASGSGGAPSAVVSTRSQPSVTATGGTVAIATASKGGSSSATTSTVSALTTTSTQACQGVPVSTLVTPEAPEGLCDGVSEESEPEPVDMIILMDRSISNSYAIGSESATPAEPGTLRRWDVLTSAMQALAGSEDAKAIGASITFFSITGGNSDAENCNAADYSQPAVPLGLLGDNGPRIVAAMQELIPAGLTPLVPALTGVYRYAMAERKRDATREKVVVVISDGYPTQCKNAEGKPTAISDVSNVIAEAATAPVPIRTYIVGIGAPETMSAGKFNLMNYARAGGTGKPPFVLDEAAGADEVETQLVKALRNISSTPLTCEYIVKPQMADLVVDPELVRFTFKPNVGEEEEIPKVGNASSCTRSMNGGWYFNDVSNPTKILVCPCTCAYFGAGRVNVTYGCKPRLEVN